MLTHFIVIITLVNVFTLIPMVFGELSILVEDMGDNMSVAWVKSKMQPRQYNHS